jgi:hypothetical protein
MKHRRSLMIGLASALAGVLLLSGVALAQNQGGGPAVCPVGQGNQLCTGGPGGTCAVTPAPKAGNQNCLYGAGQSQKRKGMKGSQGGGQSTQPTTPDNSPATSK